jgi:hypothetical protein
VKRLFVRAQRELERADVDDSVRFLDRDAALFEEHVDAATLREVGQHLAFVHVPDDHAGIDQEIVVVADLVVLIDGAQHDTGRIVLIQRGVEVSLRVLAVEIVDAILHEKVFRVGNGQLEPFGGIRRQDSGRDWIARRRARGMSSLTSLG